MNIAAARKEVEEESSTFGDSGHPIVIGDSPEKKSVRYEGCGPRILKTRIGAKFRYNETPKLQIPKSKRSRCSDGSTSTTSDDDSSLEELDSRPTFHDVKKEMPEIFTMICTRQPMTEYNTTQLS